MNTNIFKSIIEHKKQFIPHLFTQRQIEIMNKYLKKEALNPTEKTYLYSTIKRKVAALNLLKTEFYITGQEMIPSRIIEAKKILKEINQEKAFISGSFLYKKNYEDIDVYVISKRRKSYHKNNRHFIFITEKMLTDPIFLSPLKYSVANFSPERIKPVIKRLEFNEILVTYQWVINQILDQEDQKEIRDLIFNHHLQIKNIILDSHSLYLKTQEIKKLPEKKRIQTINQVTKDLLLKTYSKKYLYNEISKFSKNIQKMAEEYQTENIPILLDFIQEVKNESRRTKN